VLGLVALLAVCTVLPSAARADDPPNAAGQAALDQVRERDAFKAQALTRQLEVDLFEAERALAAKSYDVALQRGERVLAGIGYVQDAKDAARLRASAQKVVASARGAGEQALASGRERDLAKARAEARAQQEREANAQGNQVRALREKGWKAIDAGDSEAALAAADDMLRLAPDNKDALALRDEARSARLGKESLQGQSAERRSRTNQVMAEIERELKPLKPAEIVRSGKGKEGKAPLQEQPMESWESELRAKLAQPIAIEFQETPLPEAVKQLAAISGINIVIDPKCSDKAAAVTIPRTQMPLGSLLRWVARFGGMDYCLRDGAILITSPGGSLDGPITRVYDVASLVTPPNEGQPLAFQGPIEPIPHPTQPTQQPKPDPEVVGQGWADYIRATIATKTWERSSEDVAQEKAQYTIAYRNGRIVVVHTPEVHKQIEELLNEFRKARNLQVHVMARFIEISKEYLDSIDTSLTYDSHSAGDATVNPERYRGEATVSNITGIGTLSPRFANFTRSRGLSLSYQYLGKEAVSALLEAVLQERKGTLLDAPRLTCFNTQRANLQVLRNFNYVRRVTTDAEPEIGNIPEGIIFDVQPFVSADRRYITLVLQPQMRLLIGTPLRFQYSTEVETVIAPGGGGIALIQHNFIEIPTTSLRSMGTTVTVPNGGTLLLGGFTEVEEVSGTAGVPFLEGIPLLRYLIRGWDRAEGRRSLIMLVTAQTVPDIFEE
jgi:type II secretory pathway component GspD/PulD (secretin)